MDYMAQFQAQLTDPFRIGLLLALLLTMLRTQNATGTLIPLAAGLVFVAVIIPSTIAPPAAGGMLAAVLTGLAANAIWMAVLMAALRLLRRRKA